MPRSRKQNTRATRYGKAFLRDEEPDPTDGITNDITPEKYYKNDNQQSLDQAVYQALLKAEKAKTTEEQMKIIYGSYNDVLLFCPSNYEHFTMIDVMNETIVKAVQIAIDKYTQDHIAEALQAAKSISNQDDKHIPELLRKEIANLETVIRFYGIIEKSMDLGNKTSAFDVQRAKQLIDKCREIISQIKTTYNVVIEHMPSQPHNENPNQPHAWPDANQGQQTYPQHGGWPHGNQNWPQIENVESNDQNEQALIPWTPAYAMTREEYDHM